MFSSRLFGKSSVPRAEAKQQAPQSATTTQAGDKIADSLRLLELREAHVMRLVDKEIETARGFVSAGRQKHALECMKRKRLHEQELERLMQQKMNLMQTDQMLQSLQFNSLITAAQSEGAVAIETEVKKVNGVEGVEAVIDRAEDALADGNEILQAGARVMGEAASMDDAELLEELEQMEQAELTADLTSIIGSTGKSHAESSTQFATVPRSIPQTTPSLARSTEREAERELAQLAARMNMEEAMPLPMAAIETPMKQCIEPSKMKLCPEPTMPMLAAY